MEIVWRVFGECLAGVWRVVGLAGNKATQPSLAGAWAGLGNIVIKVF